MTDLVDSLRKRAAIRRSIPRGEPDRIADQLEAAADEIESLRKELAHVKANHTHLIQVNAILRSRPDLPVDRLPAIAAIEKIHAFMVEKVETAEAQVKRVQELHTGLMKAADERYDFIYGELRKAETGGIK